MLRVTQWKNTKQSLPIWTKIPINFKPLNALAHADMAQPNLKQQTVV